MPFFKLDTNLPKEKITPEFLKSTSEVIAKTLGKPLSYVAVQVNPDQALVWGGTDAPAGYATLMSIGQLGIEPNKKHSSTIYDHISKNLGIPKNRMYIHFIDAPPSAVGYNGATFHPILGDN